MNKNALFSLVMIAALASASVAAAQEAPAPRRMPRIPVSHELLPGRRNAAPPSHHVTGPATILDGEKLHVGATDLRLFGVVAPQLSANFGPQARAALDKAANGQDVSCDIRDRDREGWLLATCAAANGEDLGLELLKRGLAVTARGSLSGTELDTPYLAAEQNAQNEKIGLWSIGIPAGAPAAAPATKPQAKEQTTEAKPAPHADAASGNTVSPTTNAAETTVQAKVAADVIAQHAGDESDNAGAWAQGNEPGFFERYQILIAVFLMMGTAMGIIAALWMQKRRDKIDDTRATAAALRGELMAARAICAGRIREITSEAQDKSAAWPRIRTTLYAAYVGRLGLLGAELARQIASIYGQASDYAALYAGNTTNSAAQNTPKKASLETLIRHIDAVLPKLAAIEHGRPRTDAPSAAPAPRPAPVTTQPIDYAEPASSAAPAEPSPMRHPAALWESVRAFIQNHRAALTEPPAPPHHDPAVDPEISEYAAMIEADMARYQMYSETIDPLDISPDSKPKSRTGS
ncbi:MAG: thermonuclease family protein [Alphaproteobacteria bacterium]|nr:thermonuclease family protein [Alphaproteobacteria bacterium]